MKLRRSEPSSHVHGQKRETIIRERGNKLARQGQFETKNEETDQWYHSHKLVLMSLLDECTVKAIALVSAMESG